MLLCYPPALPHVRALPRDARDALLGRHVRLRREPLAGDARSPAFGRSGRPGSSASPSAGQQLERRAREAAGAAPSPAAGRGSRGRAGGRRRPAPLGPLGGRVSLRPRSSASSRRTASSSARGFGMTEATGGITMTPPGEYEDGIGRPPAPRDPRPARRRRRARDRRALRRPLPRRAGAARRPEERWVGRPATSSASRPSGYLEIVDRVKDIYKNSRGQTIAPAARRAASSRGSRESAASSSPATGGTTTSSSSSPTPETPSSPATHVRGERPRLPRAGSSPRRTATSRRTSASSTSPSSRATSPWRRGELTPKGSYRRKVIEKAFSGVIEGLYRSRVVHARGARTCRSTSRAGSSATSGSSGGTSSSEKTRSSTAGEVSR